MMTTSDPGISDELMGVVRGLGGVVRRRLRAVLPGPRLRGSQVELLRALEAQPGLGVAAAARVLHLAANSVSTLAGQLIDAGLLSRDTDPADRRAARLHLTPTAADRLGRWREERNRLVGSALERLPAADVEAITAALPALRRLLDELAAEEQM